MKKTIVQNFQKFLPCKWNPTDEQLDTLDKLCLFAKEKGVNPRKDYEKVLLEAVNQKLALNNAVYKHILDVAFLEKVKLNYILKTKIKNFLDSTDMDSYILLLQKNKIISEKLIKAFTPVRTKDTKKALANVFDNDPLYKDVYASIFSRFCFNLFDTNCTTAYFSGINDSSENYFDFINHKYPDICNREHALGIIDISPDLFKISYENGCNAILQAIKSSYEIMNNHCVLGVYIPHFASLSDGMQWKLYSDIILFAEKFEKDKINKSYFKWTKIASQTCNYIERIVPYNAEFEYAFQGFVFKDCFILQHTEDNKYDLMLILEKNSRDERIVNCPACRSDNIQGNSYPILNVKSWECENPLCPDRSKYNRGKRYSFMSLFRQKEMMNDTNLIPDISITKWHLDCLPIVKKQDAFEMLVKHYSCVNDGIFVYTNEKFTSRKYLNRRIRAYNYKQTHLNLLSDFKNSTFFYRYIQANYRNIRPVMQTTFGNATVICGDALDALRKMDNNIIDGTITSPPYYNAKSYSQWPNIYCYLYDMYNIFIEIYRVMKEGAILLFNIFDYFDNENSVALSAMGNKRMILGAYMIDIFQRIGFSICGNIIWNKGEIQGNRSFNQGNMTPYYQAPLNCWEHILILSKGIKRSEYVDIVSSIVNIHPVIKIIQGKNIVGHEAPYPCEIPQLLIEKMKKGMTVLDPFLGSGTTSIVANQYNIASIGIEKNCNYFQLCQENLNRNKSDNNFRVKQQIKI